jgi:hypothetical protein
VHLPSDLVPSACVCPPVPQVITSITVRH